MSLRRVRRCAIDAVTIFLRSTLAQREADITCLEESNFPDHLTPREMPKSYISCVDAGNSIRDRTKIRGYTIGVHAYF